METSDLFDHLMAAFRTGAHGFTIQSGRPLTIHHARGVDSDPNICPDAADVEALARTLLPSRELRELRSGVAVHSMREIEGNIRVLIGGRAINGNIRLEIRRMTR